MKFFITNFRTVLRVCLLLFTDSVFASVRYIFVVTEQPSGDFFKPLVAEMVLNNAAVAAGQAKNGRIESLIISGGPAMQEANRINLSFLHGDFYDLTVNLSADRKTITSLAAKVRPNNSLIDNWVFHYQHPEHPTLDIHEFLAYVRPDSITLETTILPVPPTTHFDQFQGEWRRVPSCWICRFPYQPIGKWPYCWFDWIVIIGVVVIVFTAAWSWWRRSKGS